VAVVAVIFVAAEIVTVGAVLIASFLQFDKRESINPSISTA
jgi:hypothetical protein